MSNAVEIRQPTVRFNREELDIDGLRNLIDRVKDQRNAPDKAPEYHAWWFLTQAKFTKNSVVIRLGEGRSIHTWRDLGGTLWVLGQFAKTPKSLRIYVRDLDAPSDFFYRTWNIVPGGGDWKD